MPKTRQAKPELIIRSASRTDSKTLLSLIDSLADYEKLERPSRSARARLLRDCFGPRKRFDSYLATVNGSGAGYAIVFETYSSFLALPTLYLEDIFVLPEYRSMGIGLKLFKKCLHEAKRRGCGRMEWVVLGWNKNAIRFYKKLGARHLAEWQTYRLSHEQFDKLFKKI